MALTGGARLSASEKKRKRGEEVAGLASCCGGPRGLWWAASAQEKCGLPSCGLRRDRWRWVARVAGPHWLMGQKETGRRKKKKQREGEVREVGR
jgi:hypothetical protein